MPGFELAPAKINLALHVRRRREDGYHELETLFAFAADGDLLAAEPAVDLGLTIDGPMAAHLTAGPDNLVLRAARLLAEAAGVKAGAALRLTKILPVASGIGGGSADAAAALRLLNRFWALDWPLDRLAALSEGLGADVPACVHSHALYGKGRGDRLMPVPPGALQGMPLLLVNPGVAVPTGPVFAAWDGIDRGGLDTDMSLAAIRNARNDLQPGAIGLCPVIAHVLDLLLDSEGVLLARMSGSGATCFALFRDGAVQTAAARRIAALHPSWWVRPSTVNQFREPQLLGLS